MISTHEPRAAEREIARIVRSELLLGSERELRLDQPLGELGLGLDSLALVTLLTAVEASFGIELSDDIWTAREPLSIEDLAEIVRNSPPGAAEVPAGDRDSALLQSRMERLEQRLQGRGAAGRAAWAAVRAAAPVQRFLFARTRHLLLERRLDDGSALELVAPPPGVELRMLAPEERPDLTDLWPPVHDRRMRRAFDREVADGAIALVACEGARVVALDLVSRDGGLDVDVKSTRSCFGYFLAEARAARGRGIGLALTAYSFAVARERGWTRQFTHVWEGNTPMLAAATQLLGFRVIGDARRTHLAGVTRWSWQLGETQGRGPRLVL
jgi:acyl carrier protein/GNAT superfamily N-acetyltransferase